LAEIRADGRRQLEKIRRQFEAKKVKLKKKLVIPLKN